MKTKHPKKRQRQGSALLTVMLILMVILFTSGAVIAMTTAMPRMVRRQCDFIRAKAIAEAGINEAYNRLSEDFSLREEPDAFPLTPFAGGSYQITLHPIDENTVVLVSEGIFGSSEARTSVELGRGDLSGPGFEPHSPWAHAIFSNGNLQFHGTPPNITGSLYTNQSFGLSGNPENIEGTVTAREYNVSGGTLSDTGEWEEIPFPQLTDQIFVDLHQVAAANGDVHNLSGNPAQKRAAARDALNNATGNVVWFETDVEFQGDITFDGYVIVAGNVSFFGSGERTINGLLYVQGNVSSNGATDLYLEGSLLAGGSVSFNGASSLFGYDPSAPPGVDPDTGEEVTVSAWRE